MGDCQNEDLRVQFDRRLKLKFLGSQVTTDAGLLAYRELDETLGLTQIDAESLHDSRLGSNKQHGLLPLLRQSIYSRLAGYEDVNDAERLSVDPAMRHVVGGRATLADKHAASTSEVGRFETEMLSTRSNLTALMDLSGEWIDKVHRRKLYSNGRFFGMAQDPGEKTPLDPGSLRGDAAAAYRSLSEALNEVASLDDVSRQ
jgi:hypothetical protein